MKGKRGRRKVRRRSTREDDEFSDEPVYCICRSSQCDTFMIACDACEEWFHGECINVTPKQAECIQKFFCQACRDEKPELRIEFKPNNSNGRQPYSSRQRSPAISSPIVEEMDDYTDLFQGMQSRKRSRKHSLPSQPKARRSANLVPLRSGGTSDEEFDLEPSHFASPSSSYSPSQTGSYSQRSKYSRVTPPSYDNPAETEFNQSWRRQSTRGRNGQPCGECENCKTKENCGNCEVCRSPKFKQGRSRQSCLYKTKICLANDSGFQQSWRRPVAKGRPLRACGVCENCKTKDNCGTCEVCRNPRQSRNRMHCLYKAKICLSNDPNQTSAKISPNQSQLSDFDYETRFDVYPSTKRFAQDSNKGGASMGSKMRRGDLLPGGLGPSTRHAQERGIEPQFNRRGSYSDLNFLDGPDYVGNYGISPSHRNGASRFDTSLHHRQSEIDPIAVRNAGSILDPDDPLGPSEAPPNYDSDEDVVLPEMRQCAGPACSKPAIRSRYCSEECQLRHESDNMSRVHPAPRFTGAKDQVITPYVLPYPDHLYCRHHRMHSSQAYNVDSNVSMQPGGSAISDLYPDVYSPFVSSSQSAGMDYVYDSMPASCNQIPSSYRRLSAPHQGRGASGVSDDIFAPFTQTNHVPKVIGGRKFAGVDDLRGSGLQQRHQLSTPDRRMGSRIISLPSVRGQSQISISAGGSSDIISPPIPFDSITPTVQYNGHHMGTGQVNFRGAAADGESAAAELLSADANDLDVDGNSSSGVGAGSTNAGVPVGAPAFRQGDEYYMMNENENIEINWPTSPGGVATASAGT